jgi:chromosome partitioning protein
MAHSVGSPGPQAGASVALTIALLSVKGGVGKTSAAVNLATQAASCDLRTLVVDLDPQGGATYTLGADDRVRGGARRIATKDYSLKKAVARTPWLGIDIVPADFSLRHLDLDLAARGKPRRRLSEMLRPLRDRYEVVFIDCAPGITLANESAVRACDAVLVPVVPSVLPIRAFEQMTGYVRADRRLRDKPTLGFLSMVDRRKRVHRELVSGLSAFGPSMLDTVIPASVAVENMARLRAPLLPTGRATAPAIAYRDLWRELQLRLVATPARRRPGSAVIDLTTEPDERPARVDAQRR